jgi:photosystem II stability/assembly factor-like uncharacterized protein
MKTKFFYLLCLMILLNLNVYCQKSIDNKAILYNFQDSYIINLDGKLYKNKVNKFIIEPGKHIAKFYCENSFYDRNKSSILSVEFSVESTKKYYVRKVRNNYVDSIHKIVAFNEYSFIEIFEKKSKQVVSSIIDANFKMIPDIKYIDKYAKLYYGVENDINKLVKIQTTINNIINFNIAGSSNDGFYISYDYNDKTLGNQYYKAFLIKPGNYNVYYEFGTSPVTTINYAIKAQPAQSIINTVNGAILSDNNMIILKSVALRDIFFLSDCLHGWIVGDDGIILKTSNGGKDWHYLNRKYYIKGSFWVQLAKTPSATTNISCQFNKVVFCDSLIGWIGGDNGLLLKTTDGGVNWSIVPFERKRDIVDIKVLDNNQIFVTCSDINGSYIGYSNNSGISWSKYYSDGVHTFGYKVLDLNNFWKIRLHALEFSDDSGNTWIEKYKIAGYFVSDGDYGNFFSLGSDNIWMVSHDYLFYYNVKENNWKQYAMTLPAKKINFIDSNNGYMISKAGKVYKTNDGGISWQEIETNNIGYLNNMFVLGNKVWIIGNNGTIISTNNKGINWDYKNLLDFVKK